MKNILVIWLALSAGCLSSTSGLKSLSFETIHEDRTFQRASGDRRYSLWTDDESKLVQFFKNLSLEHKVRSLKKGEVIAAFFNDHITEDLIDIVYDQDTRKTFADYKDSGINYKLAPPEPGMKYSHLTIVLFDPIGKPAHLGIRGMKYGLLSEKL